MSVEVRLSWCPGDSTEFDVTTRLLKLSLESAEGQGDLPISEAFSGVLCIKHKKQSDPMECDLEIYLL